MTELKDQQTQSQAQDVEQKRQEWLRTHYQKANQYLASKGEIPESVKLAESRYLVPFLAIWKIADKKKREHWVLSGDLPTDHMDAKNAPDAREALRCFALNWQMKAQQILNTGTKDETQLKYANILISRAESMYEMVEKKELWQQQANA
ncbi:DUF4826 family protein [Flocculibacter collagenilyticus]|uniref:DUF4826 family protein n=1 Tax=Flocculibacter collagenilyticus TaxID=2744479 RepID=UPI0018F68727|nr:DUF4826 family protein [Flocculibacter collagenilyticus]